MTDYANKVVTITGGTGSFGSTMLRHLLNSEVEEIRVISRDEAKQDQLRGSIPDKRVRFYVGDTRDFPSLKKAISGSNYVFHAAALKQVPTGEFFPMEVVKTNILGSQNVLDAAVESSVDAIVCLSTDKAVYPINAMGMSKALMEKMALAMARKSEGSPTRICVTRYGNVMYSRGSVLPLFAAQIRSGEKITLTNPAMTRFLMSLQESVDLVEHAFMEGKSGDLFIRKAAAATIGDLASAMIRLLKGDEAKLKTIGTRHGEKLYETLLSSEEMMSAIDEGLYFRVPIDDRDLNYSLYFNEGSSRAAPNPYTSHNTKRLSGQELDDRLSELPEIREMRA